VIFYRNSVTWFLQHPLSLATELSADSTEFRPYAAEFSVNDGNFWTQRPASVGCSSGGMTRLTGVLLLPTRREEIASTCVVGQVDPFCHIWFILNFNQENIFGEISSPVILEFHLVFYVFFHNFLFFSKISNLNSKIHDFRIWTGPNPPNFGKIWRIC
jgi:hypothetical protein